MGRAESQTTGAGGAAKPSLTLKRHLKAGPQKVYDAWTTSQALMMWFAPTADYAVTEASLDVRVGGRYTIAFDRGDGESHRVSGEYLAVEPGRALSFTWAWQSTPERISVVSIALSPRDGGTDLTLTHEKFFDEAARDRHMQGWTGSIGRLVAWAESGR